MITQILQFLYRDTEISGTVTYNPINGSDPEDTAEALEQLFSATYNINIYEKANWADFDAVEVHGCRNVDNDAVEQCDDSEAEFWSVYLHRTGQGIDCVADAQSRQVAENFAKIIEALHPTASGEYIILENLGSSEYMKPVTNDAGENLVFHEYIDAKKYADENINGGIIVAI